MYEQPDYTALFSLIKTLIAVSGGLITLVTCGTAVLMFRLQNIFTPRKEFKAEMDKIDMELRAHRDSHSKLMLEIKTHEIYIQQLQQSMKDQFENQKQFIQREMQHLSNNIKQNNQNSSKAIELVMKLEDKVERLSNTQ